jgi:hypothetical protein
MCLILVLVTSFRFFTWLAIGLLVVTMTFPVLFKPFAKFWFGVSHTVGTVVSLLLLTVLFFFLVTPVGLVRRAMGKDSLQLKKFKKVKGSVFQDRDHLFSREDLEHPY